MGLVTMRGDLGVRGEVEGQFGRGGVLSLCVFVCVFVIFV